MDNGAPSWHPVTGDENVLPNLATSPNCTFRTLINVSSGSEVKPHEGEASGEDPSIDNSNTPDAFVLSGTPSTSGNADSIANLADGTNSSNNAGGTGACCPSSGTSSATTKEEDSTGGTDSVTRVPSLAVELLLSTVTMQSEVEVVAKGFTPGAKVVAGLHSDPKDLGSFTVDVR